MSTKTPGQIAYEEHLALIPSNPDGTWRKDWEFLNEEERKKWEEKK